MKDNNFKSLAHGFNVSMYDIDLAIERGLVPVRRQEKKGVPITVCINCGECSPSRTGYLEVLRYCGACDERNVDIHSAIAEDDDRVMIPYYIADLPYMSNPFFVLGYLIKLKQELIIP